MQGSLSAVLSPGSYSAIFENLLRGTLTAGVTRTAIADSVGSVSGANLSVSSAAALWISAGFRRGDIVRLSALTGGPAVLNGTNYLVVSVSATVIILAPLAGQAVVAWITATQSPTLTVVGKKLTIPATGQVKRSFTLESWFSELSVSHLFVGNRAQQVSLNFPAAGLVQMQAGILGRDMTTSNSRTYATPTAATTSATLSMVNGRVAYQGGTVAYITGANTQIAANLQGDPVIGAAIAPDIFQGSIQVRGSFTAFMADDKGEFQATVVGVVLAVFKDVYGFIYGSSMGSKQKGDDMGRALSAR